MNNINKQNFLYKQLKNYLYELIQKNKEVENYKFPTEKELIEQFNISRITAKKAFKELEEEGFLTRFQGKGTFLNKNIDHALLSSSNMELSSISLNSNSSNIKKIGVILPSIISNHTSYILANIRKYFIDKKYNNIVLLLELTEQSQELEEKAINNFLELGVEGIIIYPVDGEKNSKTILKLALNNYPIILLDRFLSGFDFNFVTSDNEEAFINGVKYLNQRGHKKIGLFSANSKHSSTLSTRIYGYEQGLKECSLMISTQNEVIAQPNETIEQILTNLENLLLSERITAIMPCCYISSVLLARTIKNLKTRGVDISDKISALYFEFSDELTEFINPIPTEIIQNSAKLGYLSAKLLDDILSKKPIINKCIKIPCIIKDGDSVKSI